MATHRLTQVDVFGAAPFLGNPVAVVHDADALTTEQMQAVARWTNLSETTFLVAPGPDAADADYGVRIFTPGSELPFAGHPTLGSAHAWLEAGGRPAVEGRAVQQCGVGPVSLRRSERWAFAAPPLIRSGPIDDDLRDRLFAILGLVADDVQEVRWVDNGPGWVGVLLRDVEQVRSLRPAFPPDSDLDVGVVGLYPPGGAVACEVRAFFPAGGVTAEDPATGSLNASVAQWLLGAGLVDAPYVAAQGACLGARGEVHIDTEGDDIWVGGATVSLVTGTIEI